MSYILTICFRLWSLSKSCSHKKIHTAGTIRINRLAGAEKKLKLIKDLNRAGRGSSSVVTSDYNISVCRWQDNNIVHLVSLFAGEQPKNQKKRWCKTTKAKVDVCRPNVVQVYNEHMGGVDLMDRLIGQYRHTLRNKRWYMRIFYHFLNVAVANAWILWKMEKETMDLLEFRSSVDLTLIYQGYANMQTKKRGRPSLIDQPLAKRKPFQSVTKELRYDGTPLGLRSLKSHMPIVATIRIARGKPDMCAQSVIRQFVLNVCTAFIPNNYIV